MSSKRITVSWAASAVGDLEELISYYEGKGLPLVGQRLAAEIFKKVRRLMRFPDSGRVVPEFGVEFLREIIFAPFRIVYRRDPGRIWIVRVWRSERLLEIR